MKKAIIGYTGLVGSSLNQNKFDYLVNRENILSFTNNSPEVSELYISAGDARKWFAKKNPKKFRNESENLIRMISKVRAKNVILFSTIDVYDGDICKTEKDKPNPQHPYGKICLERENQIIDAFKEVKIIRLPGLFSKNLTKNFIFDLLNNREEFIYNQNLNSMFQYFDLSRLDTFMFEQKNITSGIINLVTEPISILDILSSYKSKSFNKSNFNESNFINYNIKSEKFSSGYYLSKHEVLQDLSNFFKNHG